MTSSAKVSTLDYTTGRSKPFPIILNDVGCGTSHSLMAIACEASSLGLSMIYGFQDEHCPSRLCGETGTSLVANANVRIQLSSEADGRMTLQYGGSSLNLAAPYLVRIKGPTRPRRSRTPFILHQPISYL